MQKVIAPTDFDPNCEHGVSPKQSPLNTELHAAGKPCRDNGAHRIYLGAREYMYQNIH